jgi:hypothetical protein
MSHISEGMRPACSPSSDLAEIESIGTRLGKDDAEQQLVTIAEHYGVNPRS